MSYQDYLNSPDWHQNDAKSYEKGQRIVGVRFAAVRSGSRCIMLFIVRI